MGRTQKGGGGDGGVEDGEVAVRVQLAQGALQVGQDGNERVGREGDITDLS